MRWVMVASGETADRACSYGEGRQTTLTTGFGLCRWAGSGAVCCHGEDRDSGWGGALNQCSACQEAGTMCRRQWEPEAGQP